MKKILSWMLLGAIIIAICPLAVYAIQNDGHSNQRENMNVDTAVQELEAIASYYILSDDVYSLKDSLIVSGTITLYNLNDEPEAICYIYSPYGYAIVNINDGTVPEYSSTAECPIPIDVEDKVYYNGPLNYFVKTNSTYTHIVTGKTFGESSISTLYAHTATDITKAKSDLKKSNTVVLGNLKHSLSTIASGSGNGWCPLTGVSIFYHYYINYKGGTMPNNITSAQSILNYFRNNKIMSDQPMWLSTAWGGHTIDGVRYTGLWDFCLTKSNFEVYVHTLTWDNICLNIDDDRPVVIEIYTSAIDPNADADGTHIAVVHGYRSGPDNQYNYLKVNNGWGYNNITLKYEDLTTSFDYLYGVGPF